MGILTVLSVSLSLRLLLLVGAARGPAGLSVSVTPDSHDYLRLASTLLEHGRFARDDGYAADIERTPGYPLFLAGIMRMTGTSAQPRPDDLLRPPMAILVAQALADTALVFLTYCLGIILLGHGQALLAAALQGVCPVAIASCGYVLTDGLFALLLTLALMLMVIFLRRGQVYMLLLAAVTLAIAVYVRPIALILIPLFALILLARQWRLSLLFTVSAAAVLAPWIVRNGMTVGYWGFSSISDVNLQRYDAVAVEARLTGIPEEALRVRLDQGSGLRKDLPAATPPERLLREDPAALARWQRSDGLAVVLKHPHFVAMEHLRGLAACLLPGANGILEQLSLTTGQRGTLAVLHREGMVAAARHYFQQSPPSAVALVVAELAMLFIIYASLALLAAGRLRLGMKAEIWLLLLTAVLLLLAAGPAANPRFRVPVMPLLNLAAASSLIWLFARRRRLAAR